MNPFHTLLTAGAGRLPVLAALLAALFASSPVHAQKHKYHFHYRHADPDTSNRYLYDWYEIEPDGWMRRDVGMFAKELNSLYGAIEPEMHPEGTAIHLRARSLSGEVLDERILVCRDTTFLQFGPVESAFVFDAFHEADPNASIFDSGYAFVVEDDQAVVEFFNLTDGKVRYDHVWLDWDDEAEDFRTGQGAKGRSSDSVIRIPVNATDALQLHYFEFITADKDTVSFNVNVIGDDFMGSHLHFSRRDGGAIVVGRVLPVEAPR